MKRTKLKDRTLPKYTRGEELFNMISHIVGGGLGIIALILCVVFSTINGDAIKIVSSIIYGSSLIILYTMSSIYHGLHPNTAKKVLQVIDHCTIYMLIAGTYTPILMVKVRTIDPLIAWVLFAFVWSCAILAATLTAIDLKKYNKFSMLCYILIGWSALFALKTIIKAITFKGFMFILLGGIAYTIGAVIYGIGKKKPIMHAVFHVFCIIGSILQFIAIFFYVIL